VDLVPTTAVCALVGYLLGGIPFGMIVGRARGVDLTRTGSGSTGATNALRTLGLGPAVLVFVGDFVKGLLAVLAARAIAGDAAWPQVAAATAAVIGHSYSPFIGFRGGRGVVTGMGGLVVIWPWAALVALILGACAILVTRYVSLGSLTGTLVAGALGIGLFLFVNQSPAHLMYALVVPLFIVVSHRGNIARLLSGTERKLGEKA
jgi:acyl phosphate:glycerol-3-phosphate acyltransferase